MIYYIADTHFGHEAILRHDQRPFSSMEDMDRALMENWNRVVGPEDDVYILGDFCYRSAKAPASYLKQLHGHKHLIRGNHDGGALKDAHFTEQLESVDKLLFLRDQGRNVVLCHFPLAEWNGFYRGAYHLYGHIHTRRDSAAWAYMAGQPRAFNVGCMLHNYTPVTLDQLIG